MSRQLPILISVPKRRDAVPHGPKPSIFRQAGLVLFCVAALMLGQTAPAGTITSVSDGDWSDPNTWNSSSVPTSTDTIQIEHTVAYDLSSGTFDQINVSSSGHLGYKLVDGSNDSRSMHITGGIDAFRLTVGGSFGGGSIEAGDDFTLTMDDGVSVQANDRDAQFKFQGFSDTNRNVAVRGADASSYGQIIGGGFKGGNKIQNSELQWLSKVGLDEFPFQGGSNLNEITGSYIHDFKAGSNAIGSAAYTFVQGNLVENVDNGLASVPDHPKSFTEGAEDNTFTGTGAGGSRWVNVPQGSGGLLKNNDVQGYEIGVSKGAKKGAAALEGNTFDDLDYGIRWTTGGGGVGGSSLTSVGDIFGGETPNAQYDVYMKADFSNFTANFDGTELNSDPDPLNELYFNPFNDSDTRVTVGWLAWRDFDGTAGDYRIWSNANGLTIGEVLFDIRQTDTLTLEENNAFSNALPTTLTVDEETTVADLFTDPSTTLTVDGVTLTVTDPQGDRSAQLLGTVEEINGGQIVFIPEPATLALLGLGGAVMLGGRRRRG